MNKLNLVVTTYWGLYQIGPSVGASVWMQSLLSIHGVLGDTCLGMHGNFYGHMAAIWVGFRHSWKVRLHRLHLWEASVAKK